MKEYNVIFTMHKLHFRLHENLYKVYGESALQDDCKGRTGKS